MKFTTILFVFSLSILSTATAQLNISPDALNYFNEAFKQVKTQSFKRKELDFKHLYNQSLEQMKGAKTYRDTYPAIRYLLAALQDNHSFFTPPPANGASIISQLSSKPGGIPFSASIIDGHYGLLVLKSYNSIDNADQHRIADSLYAALHQMQQQHVKGLIIDFTKMEGGSTLPFLCGFAPLIHQTVLLGYKDNKGHRTQIVQYKNGIYHKHRNKTTRLCYLTNYTPLESLPIAIVTGKYTASAGEMILISFLGLPNVKTFGEPTLGVPTGKTSIFLADSAFISLASSTTYDRNKNDYVTAIQPDVAFELTHLSEQELYAIAINWLNEITVGHP
ncbi:S41 family peptidase [Chitinophaga sp.]|uniref:S41 family peptidase n=1 Tax=Chitinophaga sp. TaxID=1869181 RepID=UPI0031E2C6CA